MFYKLATVDARPAGSPPAGICTVNSDNCVTFYLFCALEHAFKLIVYSKLDIFIVELFAHVCTIITKRARYIFISWNFIDLHQNLSDIFNVEIRGSVYGRKINKI